MWYLNKDRSTAVVFSEPKVSGKLLVHYQKVLNEATMHYSFQLLIRELDSNKIAARGAAQANGVFFYAAENNICSCMLCMG